MQLEGVMEDTMENPTKLDVFVGAFCLRVDPGEQHILPLNVLRLAGLIDFLLLFSNGINL